MQSHRKSGGRLGGGGGGGFWKWNECYRTDRQHSRLWPQAPGLTQTWGEAVRPRHLPQVPRLLSVPSTEALPLLPTPQPGPLGSPTRALDVWTVGPTWCPPGPPPLALPPSTGTYAPLRKNSLLALREGVQPPQRGVAIPVPMTRKALAAAHGREVLGAGLLAAMRTLCGESTSQLLPQPWVAKERLSLGCGDSRVKGKSRGRGAGRDV